MKLEKYHELFQAQVEVLEEVGISIQDESLGKSPTLMTELLPETKTWSLVPYTGPMHNVRDMYIMSGILFWMVWTIIQLQYNKPTISWQKRIIHIILAKMMG